MSQVEHWLATGKTGRSVFIHDALDDYCNIAGAGTLADTLQRMADLTGGRMYCGDVGKAIAQSLADARGRYQLAYGGSAVAISARM
jgi:hypothetical protein